MMVQGKYTDSVYSLKCFLKERLQRDYSNVYGYENERNCIGQLLQRTVETGESNSLLLVGPRGIGKSTVRSREKNSASGIDFNNELIPSVPFVFQLIYATIVDSMLQCEDFLANSLVVHLNGNLHTDDKLALKSITLQLHLENAVGGQVFGSFAENLAFLLACLKSGDKSSKSIIFILDEFDLFCSHHKQTLLYNLFDVAQSSQAPICVLGLSCRLDVVQLLEKRVKSRFSHRQVFLFPNNSDEMLPQFVEHFKRLLMFDDLGGQIDGNKLKRLKCLDELYGSNDCFRQPHFDPRKYHFSKQFRLVWNKHIQQLTEDSATRAALNTLHYYGLSLAHLKKFLFRLVSKLQVNPSAGEAGKTAIQHPEFKGKQIVDLVDEYILDDKIRLLSDLSVLEFCLIIAMKHHTEIYDRDPFNFEIIYQRFHKFARTSTSMQGIERVSAMKAYENLRHLELIIPLTASSVTTNSSMHSGKIQKEFEMHRLTLIEAQITQAVQQYQSLPTEISQWAQSCLI